MPEQFQHTFTYTGTADLITQLDQMLTKLLAGATDRLENYADVRARYPHLTTNAFCMRLKRFKGQFPVELGPGGQRILRLFVTRELDAHLKKGRK